MYDEENLRARAERLRKAIAEKFPQLSEYELELTCFNSLPFGHDLRHIYLINVMGMQWAEDVLIWKIEHEGKKNPWAYRMIQRLCKSRFPVLMGCGCIAGEVRLLNPITGKQTPVRELFEQQIQPVVMTLAGPKLASVPFIKGVEILYEVKLASGRSFRATAAHRILKADGEYAPVSALSSGSSILSYSASSSRNLQDSTPVFAPSVQTSNAPRSQRTTVGSRGDYHPVHHSYGGPLHLEASNARSSSPSPIDAHGCMADPSSHSDVLEHTQAHIPDPLFSRPSNYDGPLWSELNLEILYPHQLFLETSECVSAHCHSSTQSHDKLLEGSSLLLPSPELSPDETHNERFCNCAFSIGMEFSSCGLRVVVDKVVSITATHEEVFYDLSVPGVQHYFAEGSIHHNSAAKSYVAAAYCYTVWKAQAWRTSVFFSTTSGEAAEQRGWGYIKSFHRADKYKVGQLLEYKKSIVLEEGKISEKQADSRDFTNSIHLVLIKPGAEGDNALAAISGRKNDIVIWLKDESQLMTSDTTGAEANLITNAFCQVIDIGNAPRDGTQFYNTAMPFGEGFESGYKSIDTHVTEGWPTQSGYCEWFDGEKSPNLAYDKVAFRGIITRESITEIESRCGGQDTPGYWTQVRGFPHSAEIRDTVLTKFLISSNLGDQQVTWSSVGAEPKAIGGGDLGFREEGDPCVAHFGRIGPCDDSVVRLELEPHTVTITPSTSSSLPFEDQIAQGFIRECDARQCKDFQLDITGDGGIIFGRCQFYAKGRINFIAKSFGGSADKVPIGNGDDRPCDAVYDRMVTQLWYRVRVMVQGGLLRGMSLQSKSTAQLCSRKVVQQNKEKKIAVETKREMKKRLKRSPDDADATVNCVDLGCKLGLVVVGGVAPPNEEKDEFEAERKPAYQSERFERAGYQASTSRAYSSR